MFSRVLATIVVYIILCRFTGYISLHMAEPMISETVYLTKNSKLQRIRFVMYDYGKSSLAAIA